MVLSNSVFFVFCPVFGSGQSLFPCASPMKFATVFGACLGKSSHFILPMLVSKIASGFAAASAVPATNGFALVTSEVEPAFVEAAFVPDLVVADFVVPAVFVVPLCAAPLFAAVVP